MSEINKSVLEKHDQIKNPEELTSAEKKLFLKLDPVLFNQATFFELKNRITEKDHIDKKIRKIIDLEDEIIDLPEINEGVVFLVNNIFDGEWVSEDIGRMLIVLKGEGYYNKKIDCTAGKGMLKAIKLFFKEEVQNVSGDELSEEPIEKSKEIGLGFEVIKKLSIESGLTENEVFELSFEFNELNDLVASGDESDAKGKLAIIAAKYGEKMGSFLDIASHPGMGCAPVLAFMKNPISRKLLKGVTVVGGLGMWKKFYDAYEQGKGVGETVWSMGKYFIPFVGNYWDFEDGMKDINKGNVGMGCLNFASGIIGTGLDILSIFPPVAVVGQPAKVGTKIGIKGAVKMIGNGESLRKVGKHVAGVFSETAGSMKNGFLKFTDEIIKMKKNPAYRKQVIGKIGTQMLTKIDDALPMIKKFEEYSKSLPWMVGKPMEIFIKSIKPVIYGGVDALRGMVNTMTFKNIRSASKAANNAKDAAKATEDPSTSSKEVLEQLKIQKNNKAIGIIAKFIENNPNAKLPNEVSFYYNKSEITKQDAENLQTFLRENGYYEKGANSKSDGDIGKATIKALENWRDDSQPSLEKGDSSISKEQALVNLFVPKSLSESVSVIKTLAKTTSVKVSGKIENVIGGKLDDISKVIRDNALNRSTSTGFGNLKENLQRFAGNVKNNAKGILDNYELVTLSGNKVGATAGMFDIPIFRRKKKNGEQIANAGEGKLINGKYEEINGFSALKLSELSRVGLDSRSNPGQLMITSGPNMYILRDGEEIVLGRNFKDNYFGFDDAVSRQHCHIKLENGRIFVKDVSTNGTLGWRAGVDTGDANKKQGNRESNTTTKIENHDHYFKRNKEKKESLKIQRESDVLAIGDLHGDFGAYKQNLLQSGVINQKGEWIGGNQKIVFHGDILADRTPEGFKILEDINRLRKEAKKEGGDILVIAGNHDDFLISFLMGRKGVHDNGLDISGIGEPGSRQGEGLWELEQFGKVSSRNRKKILENMRKDPRGRVVLEEICNMKLVEQIDDTLYLHTDPTDNILSSIVNQSVATNGKKNIGAGVDSINDVWQKGLRQELLGEYNGIDMNYFNRLADDFLDTDNRSASYNQNYYSQLKEAGINHIMHGHSGGRTGHVKDMGGVHVIDNDYSFGKGGRYGGQKSFSRIRKNGQVEIGEKGSELHHRVDKSQDTEKYNFLSYKIDDMRLNTIITLKIENGTMFTFRKVSNNGEIKLIHSSRNNLVSIDQTGKIISTKEGPAFIYKVGGKNKGIKLEKSYLQALNKQLMYNLDRTKIQSILGTLRSEVEKREDGEMGINISESKQFIEKFESGKISQNKNDQYEYHKKNLNRYEDLRGNLIYYTELSTKMNHLDSDNSKKKD